MDDRDIAFVFGMLFGICIMKDTFDGKSVPPPLVDFSGPICADPACHRGGPHFPREYGCRWSDRAICNADGTTSIFCDEQGRKLDEPRSVKTWF